MSNRGKNKKRSLTSCDFTFARLGEVALPLFAIVLILLTALVLAVLAPLQNVGAHLLALLLLRFRVLLLLLVQLLLALGHRVVEALEVQEHVTLLAVQVRAGLEHTRQVSRISVVFRRASQVRDGGAAAQRLRGACEAAACRAECVGAACAARPRKRAAAAETAACTWLLRGAFTRAVQVCPGRTHCRRT